MFFNGETNSFKYLFETLDEFAKFSGCKINLNKSDAIHIGILKNSDTTPFSGQGLNWKERNFKALGVTFSLNTKSLYELNFIPRLKGKFSSGREGALASKFNYDFK